jgi:hypothetical protein
MAGIGFMGVCFLFLRIRFSVCLLVWFNLFFKLFFKHLKKYWINVFYVFFNDFNICLIKKYF